MTQNSPSLGRCDACCDKLSPTHYSFAVRTHVIKYTKSGDTPTEQAVLTYWGTKSKARFCGSVCCNSMLACLLEEEGIPAHYQFSKVTGGPLCECGKCGKPVDMTEPHIAYIKGKYSATQIENYWKGEIVYCDILTVICPSCSGLGVYADERQPVAECL